jgi:mono/diheme cytochrome c family protein
MDLARGRPLPALILFVLLTAWLQAAVLFAQLPAPAATLKLDTGKEIFEAACIACHAPDGRGMPKTTLGFEPPSTFPDFTDCSGTTREPNVD